MCNLIYGQLLKALALCLYLILFSNSNYWICITCTILLLIDFFSLIFFPVFYRQLMRIFGKVMWVLKIHLIEDF